MYYNGVMNGSSNDRVFIVTPAYRLGVPAAVLFTAALFIYKFYSAADPFSFRMAVVMLVVSTCLYFYYGAIRLVVNEKGIRQFWPLQRDIYLSWDSIVRVRRGGEPGCRSFFIDLIASPSESIQFSPHMYDNSAELLQSLEKHLGAAFRDDDHGAGGDRVHGDVAVTEAETPIHHGFSRTMLFALVVIIILFAFAFFSS